MIYLFLLFTIAVFGFAYAGLFIDFLVPAETLVLVDTMQNNTIVARGAEVIWYHWQSYSLIIITIGIITFLCSHALAAVDPRVKKSTDRLNEQTRSLKNTETTFIETYTEKVRASFDDEYRNLDLKRSDNYATEQILNGTKHELNKIRTKTELINKHQAKRNKGALNQKFRALEQKTLISEYLESQSWTINDKKLTYALLLRKAKEHGKERQSP